MIKQMDGVNNLWAHHVVISYCDLSALTVTRLLTKSIPPPTHQMQLLPKRINGNVHKWNYPEKAYVSIQEQGPYRGSEVNWNFAWTKSMGQRSESCNSLWKAVSLWEWIANRCQTSWGSVHGLQNTLFLSTPNASFGLCKNLNPRFCFVSLGHIYWLG